MAKPMRQVRSNDGRLTCADRGANFVDEMMVSLPLQIRTPDPSRTCVTLQGPGDCFVSGRLAEVAVGYVLMISPTKGPLVSW